MSGPQIACPNCNASIRLTDSLAAPLIAKTRKQFEQQLVRKEADFAKRELVLSKTRKDLAKAREAIDDEVAERLQLERASISESEKKKARGELAADLKQRDRLLAELKRDLDVNNEKLAEAQLAHADVLRKTRELDDAKRELNLSVQKKVQASLVSVRDQARAEAEDRLRAKLSERDAQISGMQRQIEALGRKAEQSSQQLQGEALELELESLLRNRFSQDLIEPVAKGEFGGDILHRVKDAAGQFSGSILWEFKRTKAWNDIWLAKMRDDQRAAKAEIALLVSTVLPKGVETFDFIDNVWVSKQRFAIPLAIALRQSLIDLASNNRAVEGQRTKMELVYKYLIGPRFRHRIEAIVEKFTDMQFDLDHERKTMLRIWAKRDEQLRGVLDSSAGLYGDLQGIAGRAMSEIDGLTPQATNENVRKIPPKSS